MSERPAEDASEVDWLEYYTGGNSPSGADNWPASRDDLSRDHCLLLDGFDSHSVVAHGEDPWAAWFRDGCPGVRALEIINRFSYDFPGLHYGKYATWHSLDQDIYTFELHLPKARCDVIPIGFSLGGVVALLSAARLPPGSVALIRHLILIAPVHAVRPQTLEDYREFLERNPPPQGTSPPMPIQELSDANSTWRTALDSAYRELTGAGIEIYAIYSDLDEFASYAPPQLTGPYAHLFHPSIVRLTRRGREVPKPSTGKERVDYHLRMRECENVRTRVCEILSQPLNRPTALR